MARYDRMTREEQRAAAAEKARRSCEEQGVAFVPDEATLAKVARIVAGGREVAA